MIAKLFTILWTRRQWSHAIAWGQSEFYEKEVDRPDFDGTHRISEITGKEDLYFSETKRRIREFFSLTMCLLFVCFMVKIYESNRRVLMPLIYFVLQLSVIIGTTISLFLLKAYFRHHGILGAFGPYAVGILNALQIMIFDQIYGEFADRLNNWG